MTTHQKPHGDMNASQLVGLFEDAERHPNALNYELNRCKRDVLVTLAYGGHAHSPHNAGVPDALAALAHDEIERRGAAFIRLLADCPALRP